MSVKHHVITYWPHYSVLTIVFWFSGLIEKVWEKTEWIRGVADLFKPKKKKKRRVR